MRDLLTRSRRLALIAGAAVLIAGCGGGDVGNAAEANNLDANLLLDQPANDASALESVANIAEPAFTDTGNQAGNSTQVLGNTSGGDTGGNTVDSNVSAM